MKSCNLKWSRRRLISQSLSASALAQFLPAGVSGQTLEGSLDLFPQGVAAGDPTEDGAVVWTRVAQESMTHMEPLQLTVAQDPQLQEIIFQKNVSSFLPSLKNRNGCVHVDLAGHLQPDRFYFYQFRLGKHFSPLGRLRTLPHPHSQRPLNLAIICCQKFGSGYYHALADLASRDDIDFVLHLGDFIYEYTEKGHDLDDRQLSIPSGKFALTRDDFRYLYQNYRAEPDQRVFAAWHTILPVWDDHEIANDSYGISDSLPSNHYGIPIHTHERPLTDASYERRQALFADAKAAWIENMPVRKGCELNGGRLRGLADFSCQKTYQLGALATLVLTDQRTFRHAHPCGEGRFFQRYVANCKKVRSQHRSMLGPQQKSWLREKIVNSASRYFLMASPTAFHPLEMNLGVLGKKYYNLDGWDGFAMERQQLHRWFSESCSSVPIILSGDVHAFLSTKSRTKRGQLVYELSTGAISSPTAEEVVKDGGRHDKHWDWLATEWVIENLIKLAVQGWEFRDPSSNGYSILKIKPDACTWQAYGIDRLALNLTEALQSKKLLYSQVLGQERS